MFYKFFSRFSGMCEHIGKFYEVGESWEYKGRRKYPRSCTCTELKNGKIKPLCKKQSK